MKARKLPSYIRKLLSIFLKGTLMKLLDSSRWINKVSAIATIQKLFCACTTLALLACTSASAVNAQQSAADAELEEFIRRMQAETEELRQFNQEMEILLEEIETLEAEFENSEFAAAFNQYQAHLLTCSSVVLPDFPFLGATETIRGWEGDRCRVDTRVVTAGETRLTSCLYTQRDIELITGPELYFPEDLERTCQSRRK